MRGYHRPQPMRSNDQRRVQNYEGPVAGTPFLPRILSIWCRRQEFKAWETQNYFGNKFFLWKHANFIQPAWGLTQVSKLDGWLGTFLQYINLTLHFVLELNPLSLPQFSQIEPQTPDLIVRHSISERGKHRRIRILKNNWQMSRLVWQAWGMRWMLHTSSENLI